MNCPVNFPARNATKQPGADVIFHRPIFCAGQVVHKKINAEAQRQNEAYIMTKTGFVKGMAIGVMTGAAIGMAMVPKGRSSKSAAGKALKAAGEVIDNITGIWS